MWGIRPDDDADALKAADSYTAFVLQIVGIHDVVGVAVFLQIVAHGVLGVGLDGVILTPQAVHGVQILCGDGEICLQADISLRGQKL